MSDSENFNAAVKVLQSQMESIDRRVTAHSLRLDKVEGIQIKLSTLMEGVPDSLKSIEATLKDGFENIAKQYVTKESLELMLKDGKYGKLIWGIVGSVLGALILTGALGLFAATSNLG